MNSPTPKNVIKALFLGRNCSWPNLKVRHVNRPRILLVCAT
jgi:hypothetical protein